MRFAVAVLQQILPRGLLRKEVQAFLNDAIKSTQNLVNKILIAVVPKLYKTCAQ